MDFQIAAVSFLNTIPLIEWFQTPPGNQHTLTRALPSHLTELLMDGSAQVGLLPVAEVLRGYSDGILGGTGIACRGSVDSVKLFCEGEPSEIKNIRADRGSRSSVALLKIIMAEMYGVSPDFEEMIPKAGMMPNPGEGLLIIGDRCFEFERALNENSLPKIGAWDLGELWFELTRLPFVFATWALAPGFLQKYGAQQAEILRDVLNNARDFGVENLDFLAEREAKQGRLGISGDATFKAVSYYFRESLRYRLGEKEFAGMRRYQELGIKHGIFPEKPFPTVL